MKKHVMKNGIKVIYKYNSGDITSFCIGFNAGALNEKNVPLGTAHALEHMVFKGTKKFSEDYINSKQDAIFGFCNAMTNYPYAIYYGTTLTSDFKEGFELYSDIVLNPTFPEKGFKEEMEVIKQELKEWKEDLNQACQDEMFYNAFQKRRIKELIIGNEESLDNIDIDVLKTFYNTYYIPENCVITVVSSYDFEKVVSIVNECFKDWKKNKKYDDLKVIYEENNSKIFVSNRNEISGAKIHYCFPIHSLDESEIQALSLFNIYFGSGTSSLLYDELRTKSHIVYDVSSRIKNEIGIKLFTIELGTSSESINKALNLVEGKINQVKNETFTKELINQLFKNVQLRRSLSLERTIEFCKNCTTYEIMYGDCGKLFKETSHNTTINEKDILSVIEKVLKNPTIQILKGTRI